MSSPRTIAVSSKIEHTPRIAQVESLFDLPISERSSESWEVDLPLDEKPWSIGLIVGPSGAGKSTVARELFGDAVRMGYDDWPKDKSVIDAMPKGLSIKDITGALCNVGFGSPPNWLRPYHVLSMGEQFRVTVARALLEDLPLVALDEFTSVVDRQVAQIASHSIQKAIRRSEKKLVAITCHYDVVEWLQPDWVYQPHTNSFNWRYLQRHPALEFQIYKCDHTAWPLFSKYHYLSAHLHVAAQCFAGFINDECVAFSSYLHLPHPKTRNIKQGHRLVVRPEYQGLGLGGRFDDWLGQYLYERGYRYHNTVAHPAMIAYYSKSPRWKMLGSGPSGPSPAAAGSSSLLKAGKKHVSRGTLKYPNRDFNGNPQHVRGVYPSKESSLRTSKNADPSLKKQAGQFRRLNTVTFVYVPPAR